MRHNFLPYEQKQAFLLPPSLTDWVADDSLARFVSDILDEMDRKGKLSAFYKGYREDGWGRAAYHPLMMVKVLVYGYCIGMTSSRKLASSLEHDVAFRYLSANQYPDFRTISDFRKNNLKQMEWFFVEVLTLCQEAGLAKMGRVALDGRRVAGSAALDQNRTLDGIKTEVVRLLREAERLDDEEDRLYGPDRRGDELPPDLSTKESRLARLREAMQRLEEKQRKESEQREEEVKAREDEERATGQRRRGRKPKPPEEVVEKEAKANTTDPDSRILKTRRGWVQGFNGQAMADCGSQVIVACDVTQEENDVHQLKPMLDRCEEQAGQRPSELLADAGYWSEGVAVAGKGDVELFIATKKDWKQRKQLREKGSPRGRIPKSAGFKDLMERKLLTKRGKQAYKQRGQTIEAIFGQMATRGLNRFCLRGIEKVKSEWMLWCATHNLLKLWRSAWSRAAAV